LLLTDLSASGRLQVEAAFYNLHSTSIGLDGFGHALRKH